MDDSFSLGQPPKRRRGRVAAPPRHAAPRPAGLLPIRGRPGHARRKTLSEQTRLLLGILALFVVGVLVWGFVRFGTSSGEQVGAPDVDAINHAHDVQAQLTGTSAIRATQGVYAEAGSFEQVTPASLRAYEPTFTYTDGASTEPNTVSVSGTTQGVGLAIFSSSGTCLYANVTAAGVTYGSGTECTGDAALQATQAAWPVVD